MAQLDRIPADQRAVLQLVLRQGRSYDDLAGLLSMAPAGVRDRAHNALEALAGESSLAPDERGVLGDYLLGQASVSERETARRLLDESAPARDWARAAATELEPLGGDSLPEIPSGATPAERAVPAEEKAPATQTPQAAPAAAERPTGAFEHFPAGAATRRRPSRLGGAILLAGVAIVVAVILIIALGGGSDDGGSKAVVPTTTAAPTTTPTTTAPTGTGAQATTSPTAPKPIAQIPLRHTAGQKGIGLAQVYARSGQRAVIVAAQRLTPGAYALWLSNPGGSSQLLGFVPQAVGSDGQFVTQGVLPKNASSFKSLIVTREAITKNATPPKSPGSVVLSGTLAGV